MTAFARKLVRLFTDKLSPVPMPSEVSTDQSSGRPVSEQPAAAAAATAAYPEAEATASDPPSGRSDSGLGVSGGGMEFARTLARLWSGWTAVVLVCLAVLALWLPDLDLPLGNSDDGRIVGRFGLQARNFWELGPIESRFGAVVKPFIRAEYGVAPRTEPPAAAVTYAHHPPLQMLVSIVSVGLIGDSLPALRIAAFLMGSATVAFVALLLRVRGMSWGPTLLAIAAMISTGFFYVYARIGVGYSLLVASTAAVAWLREAERPSRTALAGVGVVAAFAAMQSWIAMATLGLLASWLFTGTRRSGHAAEKAAFARDVSAADSENADAASVGSGLQGQGTVPAGVVQTGFLRRSVPDGGAAMPVSGVVPRLRGWLIAGWSPGLRALLSGAAAGAAVTAVWMLNATDVAELADRVAFRVGNDVNTVNQQTEFTFWEFLSRQWRFASHELMAPLWFRCLLIPALIAGAVDRRTRAPMLITLTFAAVLTFGFQQGAWVHRLWNFPWLAPTTIGYAALADAARRSMSGRAARLRLPAAMLAGLVPAVTLLLVVTGGTRHFYLTGPAAAGAVLEDAADEVATEVMWVTSGIWTPRWVSYYMDAPVFTLDETRLGEVDGSDLVLIRTDRVPEYFPDDALDQPIASQGVYQLIHADGVIR